MEDRQIIIDSFFAGDEGQYEDSLEIYTRACLDFAAEALIEMGADANIKDKEGYTALMGAAVNGNEKIAGMILGMSEDDVEWD